MNQFPHGDGSGPRDSISGGPPLPTRTADHHEQPVETPGAHGWAMWLMCVPMLLIVGLLMTSGSAGLGATVYALACLDMMAAMMLYLQHGPRR